MRLAVLSLVILGALVSCTGAVPAFRNTTWHITQNTVFGRNSCSATSIGPHAILTASHCEKPSSQVTVDGDTAEIVDIKRDGNDHSIYYLKGVTFKEWATLSPNTAEVGDHVFIYGNPGDFTDILREGVVVGYEKMNGKAMQLLDMNGFYGDSGAGIFNEKGRLTGVISSIYGTKNGDATFKLMGSLALDFTDEELERARTF